MLFGSSRRKISNVKLTTRFRNRYMVLWLVVAIIHVVVVDLLLYTSYQEHIARIVTEGSDITAASAVPITLFLAVLALHIVLVSSALVGLAMITVHRIASPYLALKRTFNTIRAGDLNCTLRFREYDDLDDLAQDFNDMMAALRRRMGEEEKPETPLRMVAE